MTHRGQRSFAALKKRVQRSAGHWPDPRGPGIIGSHWIQPSEAVRNRPRSVVTSGKPPT